LRGRVASVATLNPSGVLSARRRLLRRGHPQHSRDPRSRGLRSRLIRGVSCWRGRESAATLHQAIRSVWTVSNELSLARREPGVVRTEKTLALRKPAVRLRHSLWACAERVALRSPKTLPFVVVVKIWLHGLTAIVQTWRLGLRHLSITRERTRENFAARPKSWCVTAVAWLPKGSSIDDIKTTPLPILRRARVVVCRPPKPSCDVSPRWLIRSSLRLSLRWLGPAGGIGRNVRCPISEMLPWVGELHLRGIGWRWGAVRSGCGRLLGAARGVHRHVYRLSASGRRRRAC
jgi:hypothetical protein